MTVRGSPRDYRQGMWTWAKRLGHGMGRGLGWATVRPGRWLATRGLDFVTAHRVVLVWLATAIMLSIAWPTVGLTHEVPASLWPLVAALGVLPLIWLAHAPFLGWITWMIPATVIPFVFGLTSQNSFPWQITAFLVLLALLIAVGARESPLRILGAFVGTVLAFVLWLPEGMTSGWAFGAAAFLALGLLLRGLFRSRQEAATQTQRAEAEQARAAVAEERTRIARDLHDVVAHRMSLVVVQAQSAQYRLGGVTPEVAAEFESVAAQAREALNEVRGMLGVLRSEEHAPEQAPQPGTDDVLRLLQGAHRAGLALTWSITGETPCGPATAMVLYRVLQESLANASRHAPGAPVRVDLDYGPDVRVRVASGPGTGRPRDASRTGGHGIPGMSARAASVGGQLAAGPGPAGGWLVTATLPSRAPAVG